MVARMDVRLRPLQKIDSSLARSPLFELLPYFFTNYLSVLLISVIRDFKAHQKEQLEPAHFVNEYYEIRGIPATRVEFYALE